MLQKPDFKKISLVDDEDRRRLVKVWQVIDAKKWLEKKVKVVAKLAAEIPENKGNVSAFLGGKRPMSTNFYETFIKKYEDEDEMDIYFMSLSDDQNPGHEGEQGLKSVYISHQELAIAHRMQAETLLIQTKKGESLTETNRELVLLLKANSAVPLKNQSTPVYPSGEMLEKAARKGLGKTLHWTTVEEGQELLGKLLIGDYKAKIG